jgi:heme/copper-type cytochrome/quinol oxidase subunit 3
MGIPTGRLAVWWVLVSEVVIFGGLLASYVMNRIAHLEWGGQAAHTNMWAGAFNTLVLLTSSLSAVLAHQAAEQGNGKKAAGLLRLTVLGGLIFLIVKSFEWTHEIREGFTIQSGGFWSYYYTAAGLHAFHVIAGMGVMLWVASTAEKNEDLHRVENVGIYWHFVDLVWIFLFPLLYIAK